MARSTIHLNEIEHWQHTHTFGTDEVHAGERRTRWVIALTSSMMVVEIVAGIAFGSMALLADGWHMATHAATFGIAAFAYAYARRLANDRRYSFGTGKVSALAGFASAVSLAVVALFVLGESVSRLASPVSIRFNEAIGVAVVGLLVNLVIALLLRDHEHDEEHAAMHDHGTQFYGQFERQLRVMEIDQRRTPVALPYVNGSAERAIKSVRFELLNHVRTRSAEELQWYLDEYRSHYLADRANQALDGQTPAAFGRGEKLAEVIDLAAVRRRRLVRSSVSFRWACVNSVSAHGYPARRS